jgi:hypothetical protein
MYIYVIYSDIDIVVCFSDDCAKISGVTGVNPMLQSLAMYLESDAKHLISINKVCHILAYSSVDIKTY